MNKGNSKQGRAWISFLNIYSSGFHSPINIYENKSKVSTPSRKPPTLPFMIKH
jgi:hypothetical protein